MTVGKVFVALESYQWCVCRKDNMWFWVFVVWNIKNKSEGQMVVQWV